MSVTFAPYTIEDLMQIDVQPSQWVQCGLNARWTGEAEARELIACGDGWTAHGADGRVLCVGGIAETFPGRQGTVWAMLASGIGAPAMAAITRFCRRFIADSPLVRVDAMIADDRASRCWADLIGLTWNTTLEQWGAASETVHFYERVRRC